MGAGLAGVEVELYVCVFFAFGAVVVGSAFDAVAGVSWEMLCSGMCCIHLYVSQLEFGGGCLRAQDYAHCDCSSHGEGDGSEEAKDILNADEGGVHVWDCDQRCCYRWAGIVLI